MSRFQKTYISTQDLEQTQAEVPVNPKALKVIPRNSFRRNQPQDYKKKNSIIQMQMTSRSNKVKSKFMQTKQNMKKTDKFLSKKQNIVQHNINTYKPHKKICLHSTFSKSVHKNLLNIDYRNQASFANFREKYLQTEVSVFPRYTVKQRSRQEWFSTKNQFSQIIHSCKDEQDPQIKKLIFKKPNKNWHGYFQPKQYSYFKNKFSDFERQEPDQKTSIHQKYMISRYDLKQLEGMHRAMLEYANGKIELLRKAFLVVLNMEGIVMEENKLKLFEEQFSSLHVFNEFIRIFKKIETDYFKQSIIDYLEILFQREDTEYIDADYILEVFLKRMREEDAYELHELVVFKIKEKFGFYTARVKIDEFYRLCYSDFKLCQKINENFIHRKEEEDKDFLKE